MPESPRPITKSAPKTARQSASVLLLGTALDTTWRFFGPILAGTFIGIGLDMTFHTVPILTIIMILLGIIVTGVLITQQLRNVRKDQ